MPLRGTTPDENGAPGANPVSGAVGVFRSSETGAASPSTRLTRAPRGTTPCRSPVGDARVADSLFGGSLLHRLILQQHFTRCRLVATHQRRCNVMWRDGPPCVAIKQR